jgi:membrane protease YdiL (CAAX protease family)
VKEEDVAASCQLAGPAKPDVPPSGAAVTREWLAQAFAMTFPTIFAWAYFLALSHATAADPESVAGNPAMQAAYSGGKTVQFLFPVIYLFLIGQLPRKLRRPSFGGLALGLAFGLLVGGGIYALYRSPLSDYLLSPETRFAIRAKVSEMLGAATPERFLMLAVFLCVAHSLLEEYYWRWFVFGRLRSIAPLWLAILLSSFGFMAHHVVVLYVYLPGRFWTAVVPFSLSIALGGAIWAWIFHRTGSIYSPWLSHLLVDAGIMAVGYSLLFS